MNQNSRDLKLNKLVFKLNKTAFFVKYNGLNDNISFDLIGDTWIMNRIKTSSKRLIALQANTTLISKTWRGEREIANYTVSHYIQNTVEESSPDLMFDDEIDTFWQPRNFFHDSLKIVVTFKVSFSMYFYHAYFVGV